jgi:hypothetical protein
MGNPLWSLKCYGIIHPLNNFKKILEFIDKDKRKEDS